MSDLIIIGSGPGGYRAAEHAAKNGLQVVIFEKEHAGGTCLNCGCIPTKALCHSANQLLANNEEASEAPNEEDKQTLHEAAFQQALTHKSAVVEQLRTGVEQLMSQPGITLVRGEASFLDDHTVVCNDQTYTAPHIIIATGSSPKIPPIEGLETFTPHPSSLIHTSTSLLSIDHIPSRLVIIGAGVIGMEFASIFQAFGSEVTVVEYLKECLPAMDGDIAKRLRKSLEKRGVKFYMQSAVKRVSNEGVTFEKASKKALNVQRSTFNVEETIPADAVLIATGRQPNINCLNLEAAGIAYDRTGIKVNPTTFEVVRDSTQHPSPNTHHPSPIYAIGDVNGQSLLAHAATMQGIHVVNQILKRDDRIRLNIMPAAVFTTPEAASVGLTEEQCKAQALDYTCKKAFYRANGKALAMNETEGIVKLLAANDGTILGAHILGAHAADIAQEVAVLMNFNATVSQLRDIVHIHPTLSEILQTAAEQW